MSTPSDPKEPQTTYQPDAKQSPPKSLILVAMPRVSTETKLSLCQFAQEMCLDSLLFAQVNTGPFKKCGCGRGCEMLWVQHDWQGSSYNREAIGRAIRSAEARISAALCATDGERPVPLCPEYRCQTVDWAACQIDRLSARVGLEGNGVFLAGQKVTRPLATVETAGSWTGIEKEGVFWPHLLTLKFTVPAGTKACELAAYYPGHAGDKTYRIDCGVFDLKGCDATYTVRAWELIKPELYEQWFTYEEGCPDGSIDATMLDHYVESIEICRSTFEQKKPLAELIWYGDDKICGCGSCSICSLRTAPACVLPDMARDGTVIVKRANWTGSTWCAVDQCSSQRPPDAVRVCYWYYPFVTQQWPSLTTLCLAGEVAPEFVSAIADLAATELPRAHCNCSCEPITKLGEMQLETSDTVSDAAGAGRSTYIPKDLKFLGTKRGAIQAATVVNMMRKRIKQPELILSGTLMG